MDGQNGAEQLDWCDSGAQPLSLFAAVRTCNSGQTISAFRHLNEARDTVMEASFP